MWKIVCPVCGYTHEGNVLPERCPQCKVSAEKFQAVWCEKKSTDTDEKNAEEEKNETKNSNEKNVELQKNETKNISRQDTQIKEYLERGYEELQKENWEFATISFDKVISLDKTCGSAYVGRALARTKIFDFDLSKYSVDMMYEFFINIYSDFGYVSEYIDIEFVTAYDISEADKKRKLIYSDDDLRNKLSQAAYNTADKLAKKNEIKKSEDVLYILNYCLGGYKDSEEKLKLCNEYFRVEEKVRGCYSSTHYNDRREREIINDINTFNEKMENKRKGLKYGMLFVLWSLLLAVPLSLYIEIGVFGAVALGIVALVFYITFGILTFKYGYDGSYGYAILAIIFVFWGGVIAVYGLTSDIKNLKKKYDIATLEKELANIKSEKEVFLYKIQTMLGDDIETFEYEAEALGFMVGYGKALVEKYTTI